MDCQHRRAAVIAEARTWIGTPFHDGARVKGAGVDCLQLLIACYVSEQLIPNLRPAYSAQFHLNRSDELYLAGVSPHAIETDIPAPADFALFRFGRCFSHAALVVEWPQIIHAFAGLPVQEDDALRNIRLRKVGEGGGHSDARGKPRPVRFFTLRDWVVRWAEF